MEELLSALVAAIMLSSLFVCITVVVYHKISCTNRLRTSKVKAQIPKVIVVNGIELQEALNELLPKLEDSDTIGLANRLRDAIYKLGGSR